MKKNHDYLQISILIIFYNESRALERTIKSIRAQLYPTHRFKIIAVDDGSTDGSAEIAERLGVDKLIHTNHQGISAARNIGLKQCDGDVVLFIDAHVYLKRNVLFLINKTLWEHPEYAGVCGKYYAVNHEDRNYVRDIRRQVVFRKNEKALPISLTHFTTFSIALGAIYKNVFTSLFFPLGFENSYGEDTYFQILAHNNGYTFLYDPLIEGVHDAKISYEKLSKKMIIEMRSLGNILYYASLEKKEVLIPPLHYFLSYPLMLFVALILFIFNPRILYIPLTVIILIETMDAFKCFFIKKHSFSHKLETFAYLLFKEIMSGFYTPYYLVLHKRINAKQFKYISKTILLWELEKLKSVFRINS